MGFFKSSLLFTVGVLLFFSFLAINLFLTLSYSLKYENVQKEISPLISELSSNNVILEKYGIESLEIDKAFEEAQNLIKEYCENNTEYVFSFEGQTISVPCSSLEEGKEEILSQAAKVIVDDFYYKEYNCDFWNCFLTESTPLFLVSQKAKDYWKGKFYFTLIISLVLIILIFFLVQNKLNWPVLTGSLLIVSAIPLLKIKDIISSLIPESFNVLSIFLNIFFSKANTVFWISFISGLVFIGIGLGLKFSNLGFIRKITEKADKKDAGIKTINKDKTPKKRIAKQ